MSGASALAPARRARRCCSGCCSLAALTARVIAEGKRSSGRATPRSTVAICATRSLYARRAAVLYAPGAPHVNAAYERLGAIAMGAEAIVRAAECRASRRGAPSRGAALETRHFTTPREDALERANANLARLAGPAATPSVRNRAQKPPRCARSRRRAAGAVGPRARRRILPCSPRGLVVAMRRAVTSTGQLSARAGSLVSGLIAVAAGVACWTLAVYRA